jgi:hypothetical protein
VHLRRAMLLQCSSFVLPVAQGRFDITQFYEPVLSHARKKTHRSGLKSVNSTLAIHFWGETAAHDTRGAPLSPVLHQRL